MRKNLFPALVAFVFLINGCGESKSWTEALDETSPPNPEQTRGTPASEQARASQGQSAADLTESQDQEQTLQEETRQEEEPAANSGMATVAFTLNDFPSCHVGAVRLYVNKKYVDLFDDQGKLEITIEPGTLNIEIWDSGGSWKLQVNVRAGQRNEVGINCADKQGFGSEGE